MTIDIDSVHNNNEFNGSEIAIIAVAGNFQVQKILNRFGRIYEMV